MKLTNAQILLVLAALGLSTNPALAAEEQMPIPEAVQLEIQSLFEDGLITFDPTTHKPVVNLEVLKSLKKAGRIDTTTARTGTICTGGGF